MSRLSSLLIIGIDPGLTCGFATLNAGVFDLYDLEYTAAIDRLDTLTYGQATPYMIAVERFTPNGKAAMTRQVHALELIGAARFMARKRGALRFLVTGASEAQRVGTPDVLRRLGWWKPGGDHLNKAAAQIAYAIFLTLPDEFEQLTRE